MSTSTNVSDCNLLQGLSENHALLWRESKHSPAFKKSIGSYITRLETAFENLEKTIGALPFTLLSNSTVISALEVQNSSLLLEVKYIVGSKLMEKTDIKEFITFSTKLEKTLNEMSQNLQAISGEDKQYTLGKATDEKRMSTILGVLDNLRLIAGKGEKLTNVFFLYPTDKSKLTPKMTEAVLKHLQKCRVSLMKGIDEKGKKLKPLSQPQLAAFMKRIGDLEERLKKEDRKGITDFVKLLFELPPLQLDEIYIEQMKDGNQGASSTYFVYDAAPKDSTDVKRKKVGIFKPNNGDAGVKSAVPAQESLMRQVGAFLMDTLRGGDAGVAFTLQGVHSTEGYGAVQVFKNSNGNIFDLNVTDYALIPADQVHASVIFRTCIYDLDAHLSNILWSLNSEGKVAPFSIDHDYAFPVFNTIDTVIDETNSLKVKMNDLPQTSLPFSPETIAKIKSWDVTKEAVILKEIGLPIESINIYKTMSWIFQAAAEKNILLPGEILDDLLSQNYAKSEEKFLIVQYMVGLQEELLKIYPDPENSQRAEYDAAFEKKMKPFIQKHIVALEEKIVSEGSWRRPKKYD